MKTVRKTNYSPVRQMNHQRTLEDEFPPIQEFQGENGNRIQQLDLETENTPKEVYICDCCCVSKELKPSMEFMSTFRSLFFLFNFMVFVFGFANFGMGLWFRIDPKVYEIHKYIETQNFTIAGWIMLFAGFVACVMSLIGFAAAARQVFGLLVLYITVTISLTIGFVGTLVLLTVHGLGTTLERFMVKEIFEQIRRSAMPTELEGFQSTDAAQFLDFIQVKMRCCGAAGHTDYAKLGINMPTTCYAIDKNFISAPGCGRAIRQLFDIRAGLAVGFTSGSIVAQLLTITLSVLMFCSIYHRRANPRPATPMASIRGESPPHPYRSHERPRSRTPIVI